MDIVVVGDYCDPMCVRTTQKNSKRVFIRKLGPQIYIIQVYVLGKN